MTRQKMLIFGGSGSLGNELSKYYAEQYDIVIASRDEAKLWAIRNKFSDYNLRTLICDVREENRVYDILLKERPDVIIIAQALKQVDMCELFPEENIKTNILGVMNICSSIRKLALSYIWTPKTTCFVSTDKSCNPSTAYGMAKALSEKLIANLAFDISRFCSKVITVRYGNVLTSRGSIIPLFLDQAKNKKEFTLTNELMTRFLMSLNEAAKLIDTALLHGANGELWVPKLPSMKILDLVNYFCSKYNKPYKIIGIRGVEKIHELMLNLEEALKIQIKYDYFVYHNDNKISNILNKEYSSAEYLYSYNDLASFMDEFLSKYEVAI